MKIKLRMEIQFPAFTDTSGVIKAERPDIEQER